MSKKVVKGRKGLDASNTVIKNNSYGNSTQFEVYLQSKRTGSIYKVQDYYDINVLRKVGKAIIEFCDEWEAAQKFLEEEEVK